MGEAKRRGTFAERQANPKGPKPKDEPLQRHVLAMIDRRVEREPGGEVRFTDHSAKPNTYASADLKTLYRWDGVSLRRLDRIPETADNAVHHKQH